MATATATKAGKGKGKEVQAMEPVPFSPTDDGKWFDMNGREIEVGDMLITDCLDCQGDYLNCAGVVIDLCPNGNVAFRAIGGHTDAHPCRQVETFPIPKPSRPSSPVQLHGENQPAMPGMLCGVWIGGSGVHDAKILSVSPHGAFIELMEDVDADNKAGSTHGLEWSQIHIWPSQYLG